MQEKPLHSYGDEFNTKSAQEIIPFVIDKLHPTNVIDIGCGIGTWLRTFQQLGVKKVLGVDGAHVLGTGQLQISPSDFMAKDLIKLQFENVNQKFDLAICLEVAEHLPENNAKQLINLLCSFSDYILFSAAIPGQTGENHLNEQYPDYWRDLFAEKGYVFLDPFRERFWNNTNVEWWYRQNLFLVVKNGADHQLTMPIWNGNIYLIKEMFELYVGHFKSTNRGDLPSADSLTTTSFSSLISEIKRRIKCKIFRG